MRYLKASKKSRQKMYIIHKVEESGVKMQEPLTTADLIARSKSQIRSTK